MTATTKTDRSTPTRLLKLPIAVWAVAAIGAVAGVLLAEPGDVVGNTIPSALTFAIAGLVLGLIGWAIVAGVNRATSRT